MSRMNSILRITYGIGGMSTNTLSLPLAAARMYTQKKYLRDD